MSVYTKVQELANTLYRVDMNLQHLVRANKATLTQEDVEAIYRAKERIKQALEELDPVLAKQSSH